MPLSRSDELPLWPPVLATRGPGSRSEPHAHHAMHLLLALEGEIRVRAERKTWQRAAGVLTAPDVLHAIDATGCEVLLVFLDPESEVGASLRSAFDGPVRLTTDADRRMLAAETSPLAIMQADGVA